MALFDLYIVFAAVRSWANSARFTRRGTDLQLKKLVCLIPAMPRITRSHSLGGPPRLCRHW